MTPTWVAIARDERDMLTEAIYFSESQTRREAFTARLVRVERLLEGWD